MLKKEAKPKSKVKCPCCNKNKFFAILNVEMTLELSSLGPNGEIIPVEGANPIDKKQSTMLNCSHCGWKGTVTQYWEEKSGIIRLYGESDAFTEPS